MRKLLVSALCVMGMMAAGADPAAAGNWAQWRGPAFNGSSGETDLPTKFSPTENVTWTADLGGIGGATPIVWDDVIFISAMDPAGKAVFGACLDRNSGKRRWKVAMGGGFANRMGNTGASPSPITDGKHVWFYTGLGELACFTMAGREVWRRNIQKDHGRFEVLWAYASTGLLHGGKLYIPVIHADARAGERHISYLLCVDPATGKDLWKCPRRTDALGESRQAFVTPIPQKGADGWQILLTGGDYLTGHSPENGKMLWKAPSYNPRKEKWWRTVPSAVGTGNMALSCAPKGGQMIAVRISAADGKPAGSEIWRTRYNSPDVATPLIYQGKLFVLDGRKKDLVCMDPQSGQVHWKGEIGGRAVFRASPTGADGKIYCINLDGEAFVLSAGSEFEILHRVKMGGQRCHATIAPSDGQLFLRTDTKLYCIGKRRR